MRELNKIAVCKKGGMVIAIFFYVSGQETYKNVLASSECFACINYEAMLKDPASKGCTLANHELRQGDRWIGIKYRQRNLPPASRYFTHWEPVIIRKNANN